MLLSILSYDVYARVIRTKDYQFTYYTEPFKKKVFFKAPKRFQELFMCGEIEKIVLISSSNVQDHYILASYSMINPRKKLRRALRWES